MILSNNFMISLFPSGLFFVNPDISDQVKSVIQRQLYITSELTGSELDSIINVSPNFPYQIKETNQRILVMRSFRELMNREIADVAIFIFQGLAYIEQNKFGPPISAIPVSNLSLYQLIRR